MKTVIAIIVLTLAVVGFSYGQATSGSEEPAAVSETSARATVGGMEIEVAETAGSSGSEAPAALATTGSGPSSTAPAASRTTQRGTTSAPEVSLEIAPTAAATAPLTGKASAIRLRDPVTGASYGPVLVHHGAKVKIGDKTYMVEIEKVETPEPELEKTQAQVLLEQKLRTTIVPELTFEDANLTEVADYLSTAFDVNVVLTNDVRQANLAITMRLKNIPLFDALRYVAEVVCIKLRVDDHAVVLTFLGR
jgi:biotin carboxyl carrier protein